MRHCAAAFAERLCVGATPKLTALDTMGRQTACDMAYPGSGRAVRQNKKEEKDMTRPTEKEVGAIASVAGIPVDAEIAKRIVNSIGPALEGFAAIAGTLPFDLEPSTYILVQTEKAVR